MLSRRSLFAVGGAALLLNGCAQVAPGGTPPLMDVLGADPDLSSFRAALRSSGLASELFDRPGIYTVLAPTNLAWSGASERTRAGERDALLNLIAGGRLSLADIQAREHAARSAGVSGVPSFFLEGHFLFSGAMPAADMARAFRHAHKVLSDHMAQAAE